LLELLIEKRPAVSADRLTTSSPKREFWIESVSEICWEEVALDSCTVTPDQQLVTKDQEVARKRLKTMEVLFPDLRLKVIMGSVIGVILWSIYFVFRQDFSVWE